ncbi:MAG: c-type cytochrome [Candidatus Kapabacteria bacterium]|nr:c-type cytochrome [Candidatus Kapabacteria bacterium]
MKSFTYSRLAVVAILVISSAWIGGCSSKDGDADDKTPSFAEDQQPKAVYGKIQKVDVGDAIDPSMAKAGKEIFETKCTACHKYDVRYVGPPLGKVTERRTPVYIMNMILDTETMIEKDDTVQCLVQTFLMKMPNQSVDEKDARNILEHLRTKPTEAK